VAQEADETVHAADDTLEAVAQDLDDANPPRENLMRYAVGISTVGILQGGIAIYTYAPPCETRRHARYLQWASYGEGWLYTHTLSCEIRQMHTGRRFRTESTLQEIEIRQTCPISISR
jgi:hypothetical protein